MVKAVQLKTQLEVGRKLAGDGPSCGPSLMRSPRWAGTRAA